MINYQLPAQVNKDNCLSLWKKIQAQAPARVNCAAVESIDAAGLALLLEIREAKGQLEHPSAAIHTLCQLYQIVL